MLRLARFLAQEKANVSFNEREGRYCNYFNVGFNSFEFILDLGQAYDEGRSPLQHTRIITGPAYAKALARLLLESLAAYEQAHGTIPDLAQCDPPNARKDGDSWLKAT